MARAHNITAGHANAIRWEKHHANPEKWFWLRVDMSAGPTACWPFIGRRMPQGYGRLVFNGKSVSAHRFALTLAKGGPSVDDLRACHTCDNPPCCNPEHLWWGTDLDNARDKVAKGRAGMEGRRKIDRDLAKAMRSEGLSYGKIAMHFGVNQASVARALRARSQGGE